jgi:hypothetical protein
MGITKLMPMKKTMKHEWQPDGRYWSQTIIGGRLRLEATASLQSRTPVTPTVFLLITRMASLANSQS